MHPLLDCAVYDTGWNGLERAGKIIGRLSDDLMVTSADFEFHAGQILGLCLRPGDVVVPDRLRAHHSTAVAEAIERHKALYARLFAIERQATREGLDAAATTSTLILRAVIDVVCRRYDKTHTERSSADRRPRKHHPRS